MSYDDWKAPAPEDEVPGPNGCTCGHNGDCNCPFVPSPEADIEEPIGFCCGVAMTFDPEARGETCGGLALKGWNICGTCGKGQLVKGLSVEDKGETDRWLLAKGGRSLSAGSIKIRAEKGDSAAIESVMARIAMLPELELEVAALRAQLSNLCPHRRTP